MKRGAKGGLVCCFFELCHPGLIAYSHTCADPAITIWNVERYACSFNRQVRLQQEANRNDNCSKVVDEAYEAERHEKEEESECLYCGHHLQ